MNGNIMKRILVLLTVFAFSGCALVQPTDPFRTAGVRMPVASERPAGLPSAKQTEGPFDLAQAIEIALANNPDIAAAGWDIEAAQAQRDLAFGEMLPSLRAVGGYSHYNFPQRLIPKRGENDPGPFQNDPGAFSRDIVSEDLVLSMPLFTGGRLINQVKAAEALLTACATEADLNPNTAVLNGLKAKLFASENAVNVANKAIQVMGGHGYTQDYIAERLFRDARGLTLHFKTSEWLRQDIAKGVMGL